MSGCSAVSATRVSLGLIIVDLQLSLEVEAELHGFGAWGDVVRAAERGEESCTTPFCSPS
jgi:hypothetical protein